MAHFIVPINAQILNNKGVALSALGEYAEAITYYDKPLAIQPNNVNALNNKGNAIAKTVEMDNPNPGIYNKNGNLKILHDVGYINNNIKYSNNNYHHSTITNYYSTVYYTSLFLIRYHYPHLMLINTIKI